MTEPLPTKTGDAVIAFRTSRPMRYEAWFVFKDGQQEPVGVMTPSLFEHPVHAERFARLSVPDGTCSIFQVDHDDGRWQRLPDR